MVKRLSNVDQDSNRIINVPDPVNALDAVNKQYIDNLQDWTTVTVTTAATTAAKTGTSTLGGYAPVSGDRLLVNFTLGSNVNSPTLNIDGSGAKNIRLGVTNVTTSLLGIAANVIIPMWYDGTYYQLFGSYHNTDTNTTYKSPQNFTAVTGTTQTIAVNMGYLANNAGQVTFTLPATAAIGDMVEIIGLGAGGWRIASPAGDNILYGTENIASGSHLIGTRYGAVHLRCIVANTTWEVVRWTNNIESTSGYNAADVVIAQTTAPADTSRLWYDTAAGQSASALNAQSVQGFVPSVTPTANSIPVLDASGNLRDNTIKAKYQTGTPPSITITTNTFTQLMALTVPVTSVPHVWLLITSIEFANGTAGSANEFATRYMDGATQYAIMYHDCHAGTYFTSSTLHAPLVSSGGTINVQVYSQQASRGTTARGTWTLIDLGVA